MGRQRGIQYRPGGFLRSDDRSGFTRRAEQTRKEWTGLIVDQNLWEIRQPQDFVRGVPDDQTVPEARPIPPDVFIGPVYATTTGALAIGSAVIPLNAVNGFSAGYKVGVMLDSGILFNTTQVGPATGNSITIAAGLPFTAQSGNDVISYGQVGP